MPVKPTQCLVCLGYYPVASCIVMADAKGKVPVMKSERMTEALKTMSKIWSGEEVPFKNMMIKEDHPEDLIGYCYSCYGDLKHANGLYYLKNTEEGESTLRSEWFVLRHRFYGRCESVESQLIAWLCEKATKEIQRTECVGRMS